MPRDYNLYLQDIPEAAERIQRYTHGMSFEDFSENDLVQDAVIRNLMVIGEGRQTHSGVPKRRASGYIMEKDCRTAG